MGHADTTFGVVPKGKSLEARQLRNLVSNLISIAGSRLRSYVFAYGELRRQTQGELKVDEK